MDARAQNTELRATRHRRDDVVDAALKILDDVGLPDLSMRRLAHELEVQPSALYWHVANKQDLLAAVSARILAPLAAAEPAASGDAPDVSGAARSLGARLRDRLLAHRDGAEVVSSSLALGLIEPPLHAPLIATAERVGTSTTAARIAADALTHFVIGHTFFEQQRRTADERGAAAADVALSPSQVSAAPEDGFGAALELIVAGIAASRPDMSALPRH